MNVTEAPELAPNDALAVSGRAPGRDASSFSPGPRLEAQALVFERCARLALGLAERAAGTSRRSPVTSQSEPLTAPSAPVAPVSKRALAKVERRAAKSKREDWLGPSEPFVCDLCRLSMYWSLRALEALGPASERSTLMGPGSNRSALSNAPERTARERQSLEALLNRVDPALLAEPGLGPEAQTSIDEISKRGFVEFAEMDPEASSRLARELLPVARNLLRRVDRRQREVDAAWVRRVRWFAVGLVLACVAVVASIWGLEAWEVRRDLAKGKPWKTSTLHTASGGCSSPLQDCPSKQGFFFHTEEENRPWVEVDLGSVQSVSGVRIDNREDCCKERAIPLLVEVSSDHAKWKEVARKEQLFDSWKAKFPTERARYVRVSAQGFRVMHLSRVRLFP